MPTAAMVAALAIWSRPSVTSLVVDAVQYSERSGGGSGSPPGEVTFQITTPTRLRTANTAKHVMITRARTVSRSAVVMRRSRCAATSAAIRREARVTVAPTCPAEVGVPVAPAARRFSPRDVDSALRHVDSAFRHPARVALFAERGDALAALVRPEVSDGKLGEDANV